MRRIFIAAAAALAMSFAGAAAQAEDTLKIGLQSAMTGWGAVWGVPLRATTEMYVDEINEAGGLEVGGKTYMIELFVDDHKADTKLAKAGLERFIHQEGIKILMIHFDNGPDAWLGLPEDVRAGLVHVSPVWRPDVFSPPHNGFGTLNLPPNFAPVLFGQVVTDHPDVKTVVELSPRGPFPEMAVRNDKAAVESLGLEWLGVEYFDPDLADPLPVVTKVLALNPDMLNLGCVGQTGPQLLKLARQLGYKGVMSCSCEDDINLYLGHAGPEAAEGFYIIGSHGSPRARNSWRSARSTRSAKANGPPCRSPFTRGSGCFSPASRRPGRSTTFRRSWKAFGNPRWFRSCCPAIRSSPGAAPRRGARPTRCRCPSCSTRSRTGRPPPSP